MCGIAGFVSVDGGVVSSTVDVVRRMAERMRLRGPDAEGLWQAAGVVLAHRRLAILDLDARSNQPLMAGDGKSSIVFNGEIYNFRELRAELQAKGVTFRTTSDTEVLLEMYAREGAAMLLRLRGMFAFAIWDTERRELFMARDPYGIKPLYYAQLPGGFLFASQVKALLASGMVDTALEAAGLAGFYLWGNVPEPWTLYRGVLALPAGCWMRVRAGRAETPVQCNDIRDNWRQTSEKVSNAELQERVRQAVTDSVRAHLVSDVPVSVFLSGGIDSGTIAGLTSELGAKVEGITVAFDEFQSSHDDEAPDAAAVAVHYGLAHTVRRVARAEFEQDIPLILDAMDQPSIDGVNTWFASKAAAERGYKAVLSGVGGDELFYGYILTRQVPSDALLGRVIGAIPGARSLLRSPCNYLSRSYAHPKLKGVPDFMTSLEGSYFLKRCVFLPEELPELMGAERAREGMARLGGWPPGMEKANAHSGAGGVCLLDSTLYLRNRLLRDSDWASMAHSLELRTPLVDAALLNDMKRLHEGFRHGVGKKLLAHCPANPMPKRIIGRSKSGFQIPMAQWLVEASQNGGAGAGKLGKTWTRRWAKRVIAGFFACDSPMQELSSSSRSVR